MSTSELFHNNEWVLNVRCRYCWAGPGLRCFNKHGQVSQLFHKIRVEDYLDWVSKLAKR